MSTLIRYPNPLSRPISREKQGGIVAIGHFDGVHRGHQALLARVTSQARAAAVPSVVVTFEPHAFEYFSRAEVTIPRLTRLREKFLAIADCGIDQVVVLRFNQQLANLPAVQFAQDILYRYLRAKHVIVGDDFHFGYQRRGDFALLQSLGQQLGFTTEMLPTVDIDGERVSSTRVRHALALGDHEQVERLLGHPYSMQGRVVHGDKLGRELGFPTANIFLHRALTPVRGIYTVYMHGIADRPWPGAANVGTRPTVNGTRTLLEVHLLDFHQDIYGRYVRIEFCKKLRDEVRYPDLNSLKQQIAKDVIEARTYFQAGER